jgi:uncharacterized membrane protein
VTRRQAAQAQQDPAAVIEQTVQSMTMSSSWQGPIPPPESLDAYERVEPGLATRIVAMAERAVDMAERQMVHRIDMEKRMIVGHNRRANSGLWIAALLAVFVLGGAFWVISNGHDWAGATIASIDLVGLCGVFIYGRYDQNRREQDRVEQR